jgi:hypothetical protein
MITTIKINPARALILESWKASGETLHKVSIGTNDGPCASSTVYMGDPEVGALLSHFLTFAEIEEEKAKNEKKEWETLANAVLSLRPENRQRVYAALAKSGIVGVLGPEEC